MTGSDDSALEAESLVTLRWEPVPVDHVTRRDRDRNLSPVHVEALRSSFALLGGQLQLQPIVLDGEFMLIDGAHRLEAARQSNWSHIAAVIISGSSQVDRSLIEAEANRVRRSLSVLELERVWRTHYEPGLRAAARRRQLEGLRKRTRSVQCVSPMRSATPAQGASPSQGASPAQHTGAMLDTYSVRRSLQSPEINPGKQVIGNSNNESAGLLGFTESAESAESAELAGKTSAVGRAELAGNANTEGNADPAGNAGPVGNAEPAGKAESLARAAKRITGFSLDTLNKVSQIRELSTAAGVPAELQHAAESGLAKLTKPGASVESVYRALRNLQQRLRGDEVSDEVSQMLVNEAALERLLSDTSLLAERLSGLLSEQVFCAARGSQANREMLRATRVALTHSLAATVSLECNLEAEPARALQRIGTEVTQLLAKASRSRLDRFTPLLQNTPAGVHASDLGKQKGIDRTAEGSVGRTAERATEQPVKPAAKRAA